MAKHYTVTTPIVAIFTMLSAVIVYVALLDKLISNRTGLAFLTIILLVFLFLEIRRVRKLQPARWLFNPTVMSSMLAFGLYWGVTNVLFWFPANKIKLVELSPIITLVENKQMLLVILGAVGIWLGYWSPITEKILVGRFSRKLQRKYFNADSATKFWVIPFLYLITNLSRLIAVWLGVFGYAADYDRNLEAAAYTQYLSLGDNIGLLTLTIVSLQYYSKLKTGLTKFYFFFVLSLEIFWGVLSGFKSAVMFPFLCILVIQYLRLGYIKKRWLIIIPIIIVMSYSLIEPFRQEKMSNPAFNGTSVSGLISAVINGQLHRHEEKKMQNKDDPIERQKEIDAPLALKVMSRVNLTYFGSFGIEFADTVAVFPPGSPDLAENALQAPIGALIPRFIWSGKVIQNLGIWYTQVVMGHPEVVSSTAMGVITNLYFVGGWLAVFIGMYLMGILQRLLFFMVKPWVSAAGALTYIGLMTKFVLIAEIESQTVIAYVFRILPLLIIIQGFIYKHDNAGHDYVPEDQ